jgi:hypothetical protein
VAGLVRMQMRAHKNVRQCGNDESCDFISLRMAGLVDENGKTMKIAPGQYAPNSRVESLARENYKSARVSVWM